MIIQDIPDNFELITDSQEVAAITRVCGWFQDYQVKFDSLFVKQSEYGFEKAYGFSGIVPLLSKTVIELPC